MTQERDDSVGEKRQQLRVLNKSGRSMYLVNETSAQDKERISHDLSVVNKRWNAVSSLCRQHLAYLHSKT